MYEMYIYTYTNIILWAVSHYYYLEVYILLTKNIVLHIYKIKPVMIITADTFIKLIDHRIRQQK